MKHIDKHRLLRIFSVVLMLALVCISVTALADVGNQNRYSSSGSSSGGDDDFFAFIAGLIVGLIFDHPAIGIPLVLVLVVWYFIAKHKRKKGGGGGDAAAAPLMDTPPATSMGTAAVAAQIQAIDPAFSAEKFTSWAREVFLKLQQAWTEREWKTIRPFESEELFSLHKSQLDEYIRGNKINVVEKIGIKQCELVSFVPDGDKEVVTVQLSAVMRDYVIDATTRKVLESDPNKDWYMNYHMIFARKAGVKTHEGLSNMSTTNCPNCGAPTEITSAGQCSYCGSVITTGEHDWVLTDIHSIN